MKLMYKNGTEVILFVQACLSKKKARYCGYKEMDVDI